MRKKADWAKQVLEEDRKHPPEENYDQFYRKYGGKSLEEREGSLTHTRESISWGKDLC